MKKKFFVFTACMVALFLLNGCSCEHNWSEATCVKASTCTKCGQTEGEPLGHQMTDATCILPKTCSTCGTTEGTALGHSTNSWETKTESTCSVEGTSQSICSRCQEPQTKTLPLAEHIAGDWTILQPATATSDGVEIQSCTVCSKELNRREFTLSPEEQKALYASQCSNYTYSAIARNPDSYIGKYAALRGEVIQVIEDGLEYTLRVNITRGSYGFWKDTILVTYTAKSASEDRILEDDIIKMYGMLGGTHTYESVMGSQITVPLLFAEYIEIQ